MSEEMELAVPAEPTPKPRLVLMGEFSSGKSTLSNILLGGQTLPTQVTATRLPPVYISYGEPSAYALTRDGDYIEVDLSDIDKLSPDTIRSLHLTMISDTLELCDLVDMPGISDPNMPLDTWDAVVGHADTVLWCTHATQAWRQSEAAAWDHMRGATSGMNFLLITQFDKLRNDRDRSRVLGRVATETAGKFTAVYPVALLDALKAGDDFEAWKASGANAFMENLVEILLTPRLPPEPVEEPAVEAEPFADQPEATGAAGQDDRFDFFEADAPETTPDDQPAPQNDAVQPGEIRVMPRRVRAKAAASELARPPRPANRDGWVRALDATAMSLESGAI